MSNGTPFRETESGKCFECGTHCTRSNDYCYGCGDFICEGCNLNLSLMGSHNQEDHLTNPEEEEEEDDS